MILYIFAAKNKQIFPLDFIDRTEQWLGAEYPLLENALQEESPVCIRINPFKQAKSMAGYEKVGWCETGYYLPERPVFTFDPLFHAGCYYVQEASSMFLEQIVKQYISAPVICLDLCAAPGGKSTHLQSLLPPTSLLVSNEVIHSRASVLKENMMKWGSPYTVVTHNDPKEIGQLTHLFDVIVADLPCSGEGMFRKDPDSRNEWSVANVRLCAGRQRRIMHDVWNSLKPGGLLVYCTCTFNREENEENIRHCIEHLGAEVLPVSVENSWNISPAIHETFPAYRFYPHKTKGEGFFLALLRKPAGEQHTIRNKTVNKQLTTPVPGRCNDWLMEPDNFRFEVKHNVIQAIPVLHQTICRLLSTHLRVLYAGISMGEIKGNDILPSPALALSTCFRSEAFPSAELTWEESICYLQKKALVLSQHNPNGFVVAKYRNMPLGFMKNIGARANNLYPHEWRIRSQAVFNEQ